MKVTYTEHAVRDVIRLREFIRQKNPQAAEKISRQLKQNILTLAGQPNLGVAVEGLEGFRELIAGNYIARYRKLPNEIVILNIWHEKEYR